MMWEYIAIGIALMLVFEGIMPFVAPSHWRRMILTVLSMEDAQIRRMGFFSMLLGVILLYAVN